MMAIAAYALSLTVHAGSYVYRIRLDASRDPALTVAVKGQVVWRGIKRSWKPWKLAIADVDGSGRPCFVVGLDKTTRYLPKRHHTVFVFGFDGMEVIPRWKGSTIGRDFEDFAFAPVLKRKPQPMIAVDRLLDGRRCVAEYVWSGFGFRTVWEHGSWKTLRLIGVDADSVLLVADGKRINVALTHVPSD